MIEASATFSAFEGSLRSLLDFLFSVKQCMCSHCCSEFDTLAYELAHKLAVSRLCTVRIAFMVYLARLRSALRCWLAYIGCSVVECGTLLFDTLRTLPKQRKVEADCKLLHLCVCALV